MSFQSGISLGNRLSRWLAVLTVLGLSAVSAVVYVSIESDLRARQSEAIAKKVQTVKHLLEEAQRDGDIPNLRHRFADFFMGHSELSLTLSNSAGAIWYDSRTESGISTTRRERSVQFDIPGLSGGTDPIKAKLSLDIDADYQLLRLLALYLLSSTLLGTLVVSFGSSLLVRLALLPIGNLVKKTQSLGADSLHERLNTLDQPRELQPLIHQFNLLLSRIESAYEQQEGFNADVAHELNTPLSTLITSAELALRKKRDERMLRDTLSSSLEELHRMSAIVKDMLFLSNAERGGTVRRVFVTSLAAVASDVADYHEAAFSDAELRIAIDGDAKGDLDIPLIKRAISNLLGNATRYAERRSTVRIRIAEESNRMIRLAVVNQGPPIEARHLPRLFDRFYRADAARSQAESHHGLGLSIVAAIARMHGGQPFAESDHGLSTVGMLLCAESHVASVD